MDKLANFSSELYMTVFVLQRHDTYEPVLFEVQIWQYSKEVEIHYES